MRRTPPPTRACEVCYTPIPAALADPDRPRCSAHADVVRLSERAVITVPDAPRLRRCPACGLDTFRSEGVCSRCDRDVPPLRGPGARNNSPPKRRRRKRPATQAVLSPAKPRRDSPPLPHHRGRGRRVLRPYGAMDGRIIPALARAIAEAPEPERVINGLRLNPDEARPLGNRCKPGRSVASQHPAREMALALVTCPGEWEVLAFYRHPRRVKAAVWYLRHRVAPGLPPGRWEFARCWWEHAAVMGRYRPVE